MNDLKRCAVVGTAQTWRETPWDDLTLDVYGLNDGYVLGQRAGHPQGLPRTTGWYDLHPKAHMVFQTEAGLRAEDVPVGGYVRPRGHWEWLKSREFRVTLNEAPAGWTHARTFPRAAIEQKYGAYFCSTPAWMLVDLFEQGYREFHVMGIHLATEWEYVTQRPNFEFWLRFLLDHDCKVVLPAKCPLLKSKSVYAFEPKADLPMKAVEHQVAQVKYRGAELKQRLAALPVWRQVTRRDLAAQLAVIELELTDLRQVQHRARMAYDCL